MRSGRFVSPQRDPRGRFARSGNDGDGDGDLVADAAAAAPPAAPDAPDAPVPAADRKPPAHGVAAAAAPPDASADLAAQLQAAILAASPPPTWPASKGRDARGSYALAFAAALRGGARPVEGQALAHSWAGTASIETIRAKDPMWARTHTIISFVGVGSTHAQPQF